MASDEMRKKWGTIFMGDREASVEQLNAMREKADHDRLQKEREEDYMERVRARAADRARQILGEAYTERQKVLEEAKGEAVIQKRMAAQECAKIKAEGEALLAQAQGELAKAQAELEDASKIRAAAQEEGYKDGMAQAGLELQEFRGELGQSMSALMRTIERQRKAILENWRDEIVDLTRAAVAAGTGLVLQKEHEAILRSLVYKSLDLLESRSSIACRVNPRDEETVSELFRAARERFPELRQWTVTGDPGIEPGGMIVESGTGSADLRRENFREMVESILEHLGLPDQEDEEAQSREVANLVEQEVAHIASLTPEPDISPAKQEETVPAPEESEPQPETAPEADNAPDKNAPEAEAAEGLPAEEATPAGAGGAEVGLMAQDEPAMQEAPPVIRSTQSEGMSLAELEEELFPLDGENGEDGLSEPDADNIAAGTGNGAENPDSKILTEGGFL